MIVQQTVQVLFVAWQEPQSRRYYPVARLVAGVGDAHDLFEFSYIRGAEDAAKEGFQPFLAFPLMESVYRSRELFPFFTNRLMSPNRPDFATHIRRLGLDADADPMLILARSGGTRATDSLELFQLPVWDESVGCYQNFFWMHGFRHLAPDQQGRIAALASGDELMARQEPTNSFDPRALQLFSPDGVFVGYIPRYLASDAVHLLQSCEYFKVFVERVNHDPAPTQQRLLCRLVSCWPEGFVPCAQEVYQPISNNAVKLDPCGTNPTA
jgi:hypothetical protein